MLYGGSKDRKWEHLMLDPGHDDYFMHRANGCKDIADTPAWVP